MFDYDYTKIDSHGNKEYDQDKVLSALKKIEEFNQKFYKEYSTEFKYLYRSVANVESNLYILTKNDSIQLDRKLLNSLKNPKKIKEIEKREAVL